MALDDRPVLVAPDSFKGTLTAQQVAAAIGRGLVSAGLPAPDLAPVADGGEGTMEVLLGRLGGEVITVAASDPLGREVDGRPCAARRRPDRARRGCRGERAGAGRARGA